MDATPRHQPIGPRRRGGLPSAPNHPLAVGSTRGVCASRGAFFFDEWFGFTKSQRRVAWLAAGGLGYFFLRGCASDAAAAALPAWPFLVAAGALAAILPLKIVERVVPAVRRRARGEPSSDVVERRATRKRRVNDAVVLLLVAASALLVVAIEGGFTPR